MKLIIYICLSVSFLYYSQGLPFNQEIAPDDFQLRVLNGSYARPGQFPWQVLIQFMNNGQFSYCGGSLISSQWILSAAHCFVSSADHKVILGATRLFEYEPEAIKISVSEVVSHPLYNTTDISNDVALVKLSRPIQYTTRIQPIRLHRRQDHVAANVAVTISGFGYAGSGLGAARLFYTDLISIANNRCPSFVNSSRPADNRILCAVGQYSKVSPGDSGGPLITLDSQSQPVQVGIVSYGPLFGQWGAYVRVAKYIDFINAVTGFAFP